MADLNKEQYNGDACELFHRLKEAREVGRIRGRLEMMQELYHDLLVLNDLLHKQKEDLK